MIEVKNLTKIFSIDGKEFKAVDDVSFKVNAGEIYGIIGLSGAGKSTVVRCINRLEEPDGGDILVDGQSILALPHNELLKERKEIGMIFQAFNLFSQKTVYENIAFPLKISNYGKEEIDNRVEELLSFIDLKHKKNAYPAELSGGQKQRVAIARAIATSPKILLSDEGTSALDPANTKSILELIRNVVKKYNTTIIMITHQMEVAKEICDRIAVMENGRIVEENTVEELFKNPKTNLTKSFVHSVKGKETEVIDRQRFTGQIVRLSYGDTDYCSPILSDAIKKFDVDVNILTGNINNLSDKSVGYLIVEFKGRDEEILKAISFLKSKNVNCEVL